VSDEHDTVLHEERKGHPEVLVDDEFAHLRSTIDLPVVDGTSGEVHDDRHEKDHKDDDGDSLTGISRAIIIRGINIRDLLAATSSSPHVEGSIATVGLIDVVEIARVGGLLAVDVDISLVVAIGSSAVVTIGVGHSHTRARRLIRSLGDCDLLSAGPPTTVVLVVVAIRHTDANASILRLTSRSSLAAEVNVVNGVIISAVPESIDISRIVVMKGRKIKLI